MSASTLTRRELVGGAALGIAVSVTLPWLSAPVGAERPTLAAPADFQIDDMWGPRPRYAEPINYPRPARSDLVSAAAGSIDALFYA